VTAIQREEPLDRPRFKTCQELGGPPPGEFLCYLDDLAGGAAVLLCFGAGATKHEIFVQGHDGGAVAYVNACPHFNISLNWRAPDFLNSAGDRFLCVNHYAQFRIRDGYCDEGVCEGHWLTPVAIRIEDGRVVAG
jgi:nitrite reductase/ring-hydroxylating ferredoxin subunit